MKYILIILLITLSDIINAQSLTLHDKGIGSITIGQVLKKGIENILPTEKHPQRSLLNTSWDTIYNYYFWKSHNLMLGDSIRISDFFFATDKRDTVEAIFMFVPVADTNKIIPIINNAFGNAHLGGSSGAEGQTYRYLTYWYKAGVSLFFSQTVGDELAEIYIHAPKMDNGPSPGIFWFSQ